MNPIISVILETARYGGLDWQLKLLANQSFKDFELILIDGCYNERKEFVLVLAEELNIDLIYLEEQFPFKTSHVRPLNVNTCMKFATGKYFVFLDDYHLFPNNFLEEHYKICEHGCGGIVQWLGIKYEDQIDYSEKSPIIIDKDPRIDYFLDHINDFVKFDNWYLGVPWDWWWPNSVSIPAKYIRTVNGFNEIYCGGSGGEDNDVAYRMFSTGAKFAFNPILIAYHVQHRKDDIPMREPPHRIGLNSVPDCSFAHDRRPFTKNEYWPHGDPNLIENDQLFTWFESGYKLFQCKHCGEFGCVDGHQMLQNTKIRYAQNNQMPPDEIHFSDGTTHKCINIRK